MLKQFALKEDVSEGEAIANTAITNVCKVIGSETKNSYIRIIYKDQIPTNFLSKSLRAYNLQYCSLLPIVGVDLPNHDNRPSIFYQCPNGQILENILKSIRKLTPVNVYLIICGITGGIMYLQSHNIPIGPLSLCDVFISNDDRPKIFNYGYQYSADPNLQLANIVHAFCTNDDIIDETCEENDEFSNDFYRQLYSVLKSHKPPKITEIFKSLIAVDLEILGIQKEKKVIDEYFFLLLKESVRNLSTLSLHQKIKNQTDNIQDIKENVKIITTELRNVKNVLESIKGTKEHIANIKRNNSETDKKIDESLKLVGQLTENHDNIYIPTTIGYGGLFNYLISSQTSKFEKAVIPSQSSGDLYFIIDRHNSGNYSSGSGDYEWIQFEFPEELNITGFKIKSAHRAFLKNWAIIAYDCHDKEAVMFKTKNDESLNGKHKVFTTEVEPFSTKKIRLEKYGTNWSDTNFMRVKFIDFFTDDPRYKKGIFRTMVKNAGGDPHLTKVYLTASNFDFRFYHKLDPKRSLCTLYDEEEPWFQVEIPKGKAIIEGYRMQQLPRFPILNWTIEGSIDKNQWFLIHEGSIDSEHITNVMVFNCECKIAYSVFRLKNIMPNENDDTKLRVRHFDIFGYYIQNQENE